MDLEVVARHALLFDDDAMAAFVNSGDALVDWHSLKIDRYDVRHLLSAPPPPRRRNRSYEPRASEDPSIEFLIEQERYLDLPLETDQPELDEGEKPSSSGGFHSVAFSYGNTNDSTDQKNTDVEMEASGFLPPFIVPRDIVQSLIFRCLEQGCNSCDLRLPYTGTFYPFDVMPPTEKSHQIIARTATFVSKNGGQSEIILRVKQGDNPTFGFLMPDHHLHAYFRYLVEHPELVLAEIDEKSQDERKTAGTEHNYPDNVGGALSLLGSVYGSGDDDDGEQVNANPSHDAKNMESVETAAKDESMFRKPILSKMEKVPAVKKNSLILGSKPKIIKGTKKEDNSGVSSIVEEKLKTHGLGATSKQILEPPPEIKRLIDKLVEFVIRNGKQFEATILEQDSKLERFSFLLPSNQYHPYYLKALQTAQESKVNGKNFYPGQEDQSGRGLSKRTPPVPKENHISHSTSEFCDVPFESDKKEKFKMVIGKSKKEAHETEKESQESGFTIDAAAAAAILQAASKGMRSSGLQIIRSTASNSHIHENQQPANSDNIQTLQPYCSAEKSDQLKTGTGALGDVNSSDANLTEEQKLKAERLKRAKMFVAMLKSGALPSRTGTSRGSSAEPIESGMLKSVGEVSRASQEREGNQAHTAVEMPAAKANFGQRLSERSSKRKYRSRSIGSEDDEEDSYGEGRSSRKYRSNSRRHRETKSLHSSHHSQGEDDEIEGVCKEKIDEKDNEHHLEREHRSRSRRHKENEDRKHHRRKRKSHSSSEESENEERDEQVVEQKHYKAKHSSRHTHCDDYEREGTYKEERDKEYRKSSSRRSYGSKSRGNKDNNGTGRAVEKEDRCKRRKHSSHSSSDDNGGEGSTGDDKEDGREDIYEEVKGHKRSREDIYKEGKDHKRSRKSHRSRHSSCESPGRHSFEGRKKHRSSHTKHRSRDKDRHRDVHSSKEKESRRHHKHDSSSDEEYEYEHRASTDQPGKESHAVRNELEEGEINNKASEGITSGHGERGTSVDVMSSQQRAPSQPSETTEVPADLRAKIRAMLMATQS